MRSIAGRRDADVPAWLEAGGKCRLSRRNVILRQAMLDAK